MADQRHRYADSPGGSGDLARVERAQLCDLLEATSPDAPTLCTGWDAHHLVSHLVIREGTPSGALKAIRPRVMQEEIDALVAEDDFLGLVERLRDGPPAFSLFGLPWMDRLANTVELFLHHEDVRRGSPGWEPRELPRWVQDRLWRWVKLTARLELRKSPVGVSLERTDGGDRAFVVRKLDVVTVKGTPGELLMFESGRGRAARIDLVGEPKDVEALTRAVPGS